MPDRYRAVIFDFFGTLTGPTQRGPRHDRVARILGGDPAAVTSALDRSYPARSRGEHGGPVTCLALIAAELGLRPSHEQLTRAAWARIEAVRADIRLRRETLPLLRTLGSMGLRLGLITDCAPELPLIMPSLAMTRRLDTVVYSVRVGATKPDPRLYEAAHRRLRVRPYECLYVGDGGGRELTGARRAGMTAVRLAAPDLAGHLTFDAEPRWTGPTIGALTDVLEFLPLPGWAAKAPYWADERHPVATPG